MVGRLRERQYQLAAEKRNEAYLRHNYYQQTARYFERESRIAKHYDSWNVKLADPEGGKLEKEAIRKTKIDRLLERRSKLRKLLKEDEDIYQGELNELNRQKIKSKVDNLSLEDLKKKLKEKRMEQDLYLPVTCRRLRSYFLDPKPISSIISKLNHNQSTTSNDNSNNNSSNNVISNDCTERVYLKDTTNLPKTSQEINRSNSICVKGMSDWNHQKDDRCDNKIEFRARNPKYSARYARRSLENTNVRPGHDFSDCFSHRLQEPMTTTRTTTTTTMTTNNSNVVVDDDNLKSDVVDDISILKQSMTDADDRQESPIIPEVSSDKDLSLNRTDQEKTAGNLERDNKNKIDHRSFEREMNYPWSRMDPTDKNLSEKMYLFLSYKDLKSQINDLLKRENHACERQRWDDAIRLRAMKNELELIREKQIYNMKSLIVDEDVRDKALKNIEKRESELALRENASTDTSMYSDGAKVLWEKWVKEDDKFIIKDASAQREVLIKELEEEFENLAVEEKERIVKTYRNVYNDSHLKTRRHFNTNTTE
ncbi:putative uncharacterized protein DDB_G0289963 [Polistes fuscatus]|uniref:putative uncharacterized protein DDB_G0289963 n=1 Tax=Polistes fuscatus TaxID=30207 RepID=UPI001CAA34F6|nr:putative uncharacterized protein DDB_G0289963 [Polistes fuscatus]